jgi:hypothetical protein
MNLQRILCGGTILVGAIFFDSVAQAQVQTLDIIEHSSSSLTAKFNGTDIPAADILEGSSNVWLIQLPVPGITEPLMGSKTWAEPESTKTVNLISFLSSPGVPKVVSVISDQGGSADHANGATDTTSFFTGNANVNVTFTDNGDVPDAAGTLSLLSLSLAGLGFAKRMFLRTV